MDLGREGSWEKETGTGEEGIKRASMGQHGEEHMARAAPAQMKNNNILRFWMEEIIRADGVQLGLGRPR